VPARRKPERQKYWPGYYRYNESASASCRDPADSAAVAHCPGYKGQGVRTWGKTSVTVPDKYGNPHIISFSRPTDVPVYGKITLSVFAGYTSQIGVQIQQAVADYINRLMIGDQVLLSRIYSPANLGVVSGGNARYYDIQELLIGKSPETVAAANINIAYDESASCKPENIIITVAA
ncbi:hypothetical protein ONP75_25525, partial [Salmonella enterica subsp. enterica serovar Lubbock]|nr:hypothetical protein [Salmonella enterica subsp. enterica serovar Lubbock]